MPGINQKHVITVLECMQRCQTFTGCSGCLYGKRVKDARCASLLLADAEQIIRQLNTQADRETRAKRLRDWMERDALNYSAVGRLLGIGSERVRNYARGVNPMPDEIADRMEELIGEEDPSGETQEKA